MTPEGALIAALRATAGQLYPAGNITVSRNADGLALPALVPVLRSEDQPTGTPAVVGVFDVLAVTRRADREDTDDMFRRLGHVVYVAAASIPGAAWRAMTREIGATSGRVPVQVRFHEIVMAYPVAPVFDTVPEPLHEMEGEPAHV